jgi:hypothetical protein
MVFLKQYNICFANMKPDFQTPVPPKLKMVILDIAKRSCKDEI